MGKIIKLYLIRHARQESPLCNVNVALAREGIIQSELLGERLKTYKIDKIYSSDLIRARMTAEIISEKIHEKNKYREIQKNEINEETLKNKKFEQIIKIEESKENEKAGKIEQLKELREIDFGDMTGLSDEVLKVRFADYFIKRDAMEEDITIPGGENGAMVYNRMKNGINKIICNAKENNYENIVIVSHGGAIRSFIAGVLGMPLAKRFMFAKNMENTSITQIDYYIDTDKFYVEVINDYAHLEGHEELMRSNFKRV